MYNDSKGVRKRDRDVRSGERSCEWRDVKRWATRTFVDNAERCEYKWK